MPQAGRISRPRDINLQVFWDGGISVFTVKLDRDMTDAEIDAISMPYTGELSCCVCLEHSDVERRQLVCQHVICKQCMQKWFAQSQLCPYCRSETIETERPSPLTISLFPTTEVNSILVQGRAEFRPPRVEYQSAAVPNLPFFELLSAAQLAPAEGDERDPGSTVHVYLQSSEEDEELV